MRERGQALWLVLVLSAVHGSGALWNDPGDPNKIVGRIEYAPPHIGKIIERILCLNEIGKAGLVKHLFLYLCSGDSPAWLSGVAQHTARV